MSDLTARERGLIAAELRAQADEFEQQAVSVMVQHGFASVELLTHVVRSLRSRADELDGAPASAEIDPCAGLKVGDTLPVLHEGGCPVRAKGRAEYACCRAFEHPGQHIATDESNWIVAVWPQDGAS